MLEETKECEENLSKELFVEVFKDKETFDKVLIENIKKVDEIEELMSAKVSKVGRAPVEEETPSEYEETIEQSLNKKVKELLEKFGEESFVVKSRFFKVFNQSGKYILGVSHPMIQKRQGTLATTAAFKVC